MRVFVTGANGLVGSALCPALSSRGWDVRPTDLPDGDIRSPSLLARALGGDRPDWIVNLAAFTDVDACEGDSAKADACNGAGAENVARLARDRGSRLLHVSTDYVFDGQSRVPYGEEDPPNPLSAYGRSKLLGETAIRQTLQGERWLIVRGQSLYGGGGTRKSFPDAILKKAYPPMPVDLPVVTDQIVQPTWNRDFADALVRLLDAGASGVFHFASSGYCSWHEFAKAAFQELPEPPSARITEMTAASLGRPARRPAWSVFDTAKYEGTTGHRPPSWRESLREYARQFWRTA